MADNHIIDVIDIMKPENKLNELQQKAYDLVIEGKSIFLTGPGGVGKSFLIKLIKKDLETKYYKNVAVTSTTGISANLINGVTLHSHLGIGLGIGSSKTLIKNILGHKNILNRWKRAEVLVIDEVSMLDIDLFEKLEKMARIIRNCALPFGGIQIILTGDFLQLGAVGQPKFLFESEIWPHVIKETVYLREVVRQTDELFVRVLNKIRIGNIDEEVEQVLKSRDIKYISDTGLIPTMLYATNAKVDNTNEYYYNKLESEEYKYKIVYKWHKNIAYKEKYDKLVRFEPELSLKIGSQVMYLINDTASDHKHPRFNGSRGVIINMIEGYPLIKWTDNSESIVRYASLDIEEQDIKIMTYAQLPLRLAFAMSIHRSQGCSLDLARINMNVFCSGQAYVALSRVRTLNGLYIRDLDVSKITADVKAVAYYRGLEAELETAKIE